MELFEDNGLISQSEWTKNIEILKPVKELNYSEDKIASEVIRLLEEAVLSRIPNNQNIGIFFSGGLDSSLIAAICKKNNVKFTCYTVGFQDGNMGIPEDVKYAKRVAKFLKLSDEEFKFKIFNLKESENIINNTAKILKDIPDKDNINPIVNLGVAAVEVAAYSISKKENFFFTGIGSEEIFAGYERHRNNPTNDECLNGLFKMYERDLLRDYAVSKSLGFVFLTPFLDEELIKYSLTIPIHYKINDSGNKIILRRAAFYYLEKYSERPKKAAQYGSSFIKAIEKLSAKKGFTNKKEYYKSLNKK